MAATALVKRWKAKLLFQNKEVILPGSWETREEAEWSIALWKQAVLLYSDPFIFYQEETPEPFTSFQEE